MKTLLLLSSLMALSLLTACGSAAPYAALPISDDRESMTNVFVTNGQLRRWVRVGRPAVRRVEGSNQLKVTVPIRNITRKPLQVRVQVNFLNLERQPIGDDTNEQAQVISPGMTINHTVTSISSEARDWKMSIGPNG